MIVWKSIINGLPKNKSVSGDIPLKFLRSSEFTFSYLTVCINEVLRNSKFPESLRLSDLVPVYKKWAPQINLFFDQLAFCVLFQSFFKKSYFINYAAISTSFWTAYYADFKRLIPNNMHYLNHSRHGDVVLLALYLRIYLKCMTA